MRGYDFREGQWPAAGTSVDASVVDAFRASGLKAPRATVYADAINMRTRLAANGRFLAVVPAHIMKVPEQAFVAEGGARRSRDNAPTDWDHHAQEPHAESAGAALHRLRPRSRKAVGEGSRAERPAQKKEGLGPRQVNLA